MENSEGIELKLEKHRLHMGYPQVLYIIVACQWNMSSATGPIIYKKNPSRKLHINLELMTLNTLFQTMSLKEKLLKEM
jgi:hypothetical protein